MRRMQVRVQLKDIGGIKPEVYLVYLYSFLLILLLGLIVFLPGLLKNGSRVEIWSNVERAEFFVDGQRFGYLPNNYFIGRGRHSILVQREGFLPYQDDIDVGGRVFFSLFFPRRSSLTIPLEADPALTVQELRKRTLLGAASWSFQSLSSVRQAPPLFDDFALATLARGDELAHDDVLASAPPLSLVNNDQQLRDLLRGFTRLQSAATIPNAMGMSRVLGRVLEESTDRGTQSLISKLSNASDISPSFIEQILKEAALGAEPAGASPPPASASPPPAGASPPASATISAQLASRGYSGTLLTQGSILIMDSPVNYGLFQSFLNAQDLWTEAKFVELEQQELSSGNYFMHDPLGQALHTNTAEDIRGINVLSIFAFIEWLQEGLAGVHIRLPQPSELADFFALHPNPSDNIADNIAANKPTWEYTAQYAQIQQSAMLSQQELPIETAEMKALQDGLLGGKKYEAGVQLFLTSAIHVQNSTNEVGVLRPTMVSPVTTFRLIFERQ